MAGMGDIVKYGLIGLAGYYVYETFFANAPAVAGTATTGVTTVPVTTPPTGTTTAPPVLTTTPPVQTQTIAQQLSALAQSQYGSTALDADQWSYYMSQILGTPVATDGTHNGNYYSLWLAMPTLADGGRSIPISVSQYLANYAAAGLPVPSGRSLQGLNGLGFMRYQPWQLPYRGKR